MRDLKGKPYLFATSGEYPAGVSVVVLHWRPYESGSEGTLNKINKLTKPIKGYNLYRNYRGKTIRLNNNGPITTETSYEDFERRVPKGTAEWDLLNRAFEYLDNLKFKANSKIHKQSIQGAEQKVIGKFVSRINRLEPAFMRGLRPEELEIFRKIASVNLKLRVVFGLAFLDTDIDTRETDDYVYSLKALGLDDTEIPLPEDVRIKYGDTKPPKPPSEIYIKEGDREVEVSWERDKDDIDAVNTFGYSVQRSGDQFKPAVSWTTVSLEPVFYKHVSVDESINTLYNQDGLDISVKKAIEKSWEEGTYSQVARDSSAKEKIVFVDQKILTEKPGEADPKLNFDHSQTPPKLIEVPVNDKKYQYRVGARDILGRVGDWSNPVDATPKRSTAPKAPINFEVHYISVWKPGHIYKINEYVHYVKKVFRSKTNHTSSSSNKPDLKSNDIWEMMPVPPKDPETNSPHPYQWDPPDVIMNNNKNDNKGLLLTWQNVTRDIKNRWIDEALEKGRTINYEIWRAKTAKDLEELEIIEPGNALNNNNTSRIITTKVYTTSFSSQDKIIIAFIDTGIDAAKLLTTEEETEFWYKVRAVLNEPSNGPPEVPPRFTYGNFSPAISGRIPDLSVPGSTKLIKIDRPYRFDKENEITIRWNPNKEMDLTGYQIYRGLCDRGEIYPKNPKSTDKPQEDESSPFVLIGVKLLKEARDEYLDKHQITFTDNSIPEGSPICYAYWVRAYDISGNLYQGDHGYPTNKGADDIEFECRRLREKSPPQPPIITGLQARSKSVKLTWVAPPVQDIRAFHVYRSTEEKGPLKWVGGVLVENGKIKEELKERFPGIEEDCQDVSAEPYPQSIQGSFVDDDIEIEPNRVYWYRVTSLDWLRNESGKNTTELLEIPAMWTTTATDPSDRELIGKIPESSTFTYSINLPEKPIITASLTQLIQGCGLSVSWKPATDPSKLRGFLVFRSISQTGSYRQVSPIIENGNSYIDKSALRNTDYWYRVQAMDKEDKLSEPSEPMKFRY